MSGWYSQCFFTAWSWNILGLAFFLSGLIPMLVHFGRESTVIAHPWLLRSALVGFEVAAPCAFLTSFIVTYALWPRWVHNGSSYLIFESGLIYVFRLHFV